MEYLNFEVEIERLSGQDYRVATRSPAGEARAVMRFPFGEQALKDLHKDLRIALLSSAGLYRQMLSPEEQTVRDFGQQVFDAVMAADVRSSYDRSHQLAEHQGKGLRLKFCILAPELATLPWEYLFDQRQGRYLCLSLQTPLVRTLPLPRPLQPLTVIPPLRILGMIASPTSQATPALDVAREQRRMREALRDLEVRKLVELHWLPGQTWRDLNRAMRSGPWHIFHFIGHGGFDRQTDQGVLVFANEEGQPHMLAAGQVAPLLADHRPLRLVVLNACEGSQGSQRDLFSSTAASLAQQGIPAILAMQYAISDQAAIECTRTFYECLAEGVPVDEAVTEARRAISLEQASLEWGTPVLHLRALDGVLFDITERSPVANQEMGGHPILANRSIEERSFAPLSGRTDQVKPVQVETPEPKNGGAAAPSLGRDNLSMIDLGFEAARAIGADHHPVSLTELHAAYLRANPGISRGKTLDSFGATISYHTINMRSRFPEPGNKKKITFWLTRPLFKRVGYGQYMLLSPDELALFQRLVEAGDPGIYADEYDLSEFALPSVQPTAAVSEPPKTNSEQEQASAYHQEYKQGTWTKEEIVQLKQDIRNQTVLLLLNVAAERAPGWVDFDEICEKAGRTQRQVMGDLAGFTPLVKRYGKQGQSDWPVETKWGTSPNEPTKYRMQPTLAE